MSHPPPSLSAAATAAAVSSNGDESVDPRAAQLRALILSACQTAEEHASPSNGHASGGSDWATLSALVDSCLSARLPLSDLLPVDTYQHLLSHLLLPAMCGGTDASLRLLSTATADLPAIPSAADLSLLLQPALNAAALTLQLLCMPYVPRPLIREDYIEQVVTLVRSVLKRIVLPVYEAGAREKLLAAHANHAAAAAAQGRSPGEPSSWAHVEQQFRFLVPKSASLLSSLTRFLTLEKLPDRVTHQLLEMGYEVLGATLLGGAAADAALWHSLESACAQLIQKMFVQGGDLLKRSVLDNLASTYRHLSPTRRHLRSYVVQQGNQRVKKEEAGGGGAAGGSSMVAAAAAASAASSQDVAAIGSSIPLPAPLLPGHQPQVSIQLISSLVLHLLQSLAAAPLLAEREAEDAVPLLERIQREVRAKEIADAAARPAETKKQTSNKKKGSKKKVKAADADVIDLANTDEDEPMSAGASSAAPPAASAAPSFFTSLHSSLDNPAVRDQFVSTLSAPMQSVREYALYFLHKLFDRLQPPPKDSPLAASSTALSKKVSKQLLRLFIEDLLQVMFMPEFPVAEEMVYNTIKMIVANLSKKDRPVSEAFRLNCLSMLDLISLHLKLHLQIGEAHPIRIRPHKKLVEEERQQQQQQQAVQARESNMDDITEEGEALVESKEEELDCVCGASARYADLAALVKDANVRQWFLLDCDLYCLGFTEGNTPSEWKCSRCIIRKECENQMKELQRRRERLLSLKDSFTPSPAKRKGKGKGGPSSPNHAAASAAAALAQVEQELTPLAASDVTKVSSSVLRQLLINYMNAQVTQKEEEEMLYARQFDLCAWMQEAKVSEEKEAEEKEKEREKTKGVPLPSLSVSLAFQRELDICQLNWEPPLSAASASAGLSATAASTAASSSSSSAPLLISREVAINMSRQLCVDRPGSVLRLHSRLLDSLCAHCNDPAPQCRATAVATLAHMVRVDPTLLKEPKVKAALSRRADDSSITTREAVVELIGTHVLQAQAEFNQQQQHVKVEDPAAAAAAASALSSKYTLDPEYLPFLLARLSDESVSIRKKVVRILRDLCLQSPPHPRYAELCERLILCVRDGEESMQSLSVTIVFEMWFDRTKEAIKERKSKKVKVKLEEEGKTEGQLKEEEEQDESVFSKEFQQLVQNIINVNNRLYASSNLSTGSLSDGAESLADIITLLLEQDAHLAKSSPSASGEMTSLTGLKMNLLKLSREQRKKQAKAAAEANQKPHHVSSLTQAFENADAAPKGRRKGGAAAAAASSSAAAASSTITPSHPHSMPSICEDMVSCIVEKIITQGKSGETTTANGSNGTAAPSLLPCMQALHLFTQVQPALLLPHLETLRPYLNLASSPQQPAKTPAEQAAQRQTLLNHTACVTLQLDMLREVLPIIVTPTASMSKAASQAAASLASNTHFANKLFEPLHKLLLNSQQTTLIKAVIPPLVLVCEKLLRSAEPLLKVFRAFITFLWIHQLPSQGAAIHPLHIVRSLIGIGLICKHFDVEAFLAQENAQLQAEGKPKQTFWSEIYSSVSSQPKVNWSQLQPKSAWMQRADQGKQPVIVERLFDLFKTHLKIMDAARMEAAAKGNQALVKQEANKQLSALQGIIALFSRKPTLISQSKDVMEICLNPSAPADLLRYSVRALREFLEHEDRRVHQSQTKERAKAIKKKKKMKKGSSSSSKKKGKQQAESPEEEDEEQEEEEEEEMEHESEGASFASPASSTAQSWVAATIDTADFLPTLVGMCEHHIYSLTYSPPPPIRYECLQLLRLVLQQGVTNPVDAMAPLVAALTDREPLVAKVARAIVTEVVGHKKELVRFLEQRFAEGIRCSFELQSRLYPKRFDPLHRTNLREGSPPAHSPPVYDNTPTDGLAKAYNLLQKSAATRKAFCKTFVLDLMNVSHIGIFAREAEEAEADEMTEVNGTNGAGHNGFISPSKSLSPHPSLHKRSQSSDSIAGSPATPTKDLNEDFPAFVPPVLESPSFASPSSVQSSPSGASLFDVASSHFSSPASAPSSPLSYLSYLAGLCAGLPFEDDEPLHLSFHLSKIINTRGAALQANIQRTIVALKKMAGESVQEEEEDEANLVAQKQEEDNGTSAQSISDLPADQESLLALLQLQCESAMAITILIRLRQWLQEAYDLSGRFEEWNIHASGTPAASSSSSTSPAHRGALKLSKKSGIPLHFNDLPLSEEQAQQLVATTQPGSNASSSHSPLRVGARGSKAASHARHSSAPVYASSSRSSVIPLLCQAQSLYFHHSMERNAIFLAAKPSRRGHKRAATVGEWSGEDGSTAGSADSTPVKKRRTSGQAKRRRRRMDSSDDTSEEEMEWEEEEEESPRKSPAAVAGGRSGGRSRRSARKPTRYQQISEEDEEDIRMEEEEEEAYEQNSEQAEEEEEEEDDEDA